MSNTHNLTEKALNTYKNRANNVHYSDHQSIVMNRKTKTLDNTITVLSPKSHLQTKELYNTNIICLYLYMSVHQAPGNTH